MSDKQKLDELRDELEAKRRSDPVAVIAGQASVFADQTRDAVSSARQQIDSQAETLAEKIREQPFAAIAVAAGIGYLLGRVTR